MNRRDFLLRSTAAAGAFGLSGPLASRLALAAEDTDHHFVFCYFEGGWDMLLGLDPRDPKDFTAASLAETGIEPAYDRLPAQFSRAPINAGPFTFGPCIGELAQQTDHFSVVRGINMGTLTHEVGRRYFITGKAPSGLRARGSSVASLAADQLGGGRPVPHLAHRVESYSEGLAPHAAAMSVAAVSHLQYILRDGLGIPTPIRATVHDALAAYRAKREVCKAGPSGSQLAAVYRANRERAAQVVKSELYKDFEFAGPQLAEVRARYGVDGGNPETAFGRAALAAQALKSGLSRVVSVALAVGLDTHDSSWANTHSLTLQQGFDALARLIVDLRESGLLGKTTILAFSEFGRTSRINATNGRDHNLCNTALVAGAGIQPGLVIGSSSDNGMGPNPIDLATGQASEQGISLRPEHVMTTVLHAAGLDASELRSQPIPTLLPQ